MDVDVFSPAEAIKFTLLELIDHLQRVLSSWHDQADMNVIKFFIEKQPVDVLAKKLRGPILKYQKEIEDHKISFVQELEPVFEMLPRDRRVHLLDLLTGRKPGFSDENRELFFDYFNTILDNVKDL